ncbi:MAG: SIMPL domain-containing protein [Brooklawnia sp.]|uniref:SIMPL domain-containing protein n=1 Tax=Brooklawnia sp. TaxID=2699740 RepID=UPI003C755025
MEITVVGHSSRNVEPEVGVLHVRVGFEGQDKQEVVQRTRAVAAAVTEFAEQHASAEDRVVVDALRTYSWAPTSTAGEVMADRWNAGIDIHVRAHRIAILQEIVDDVGTLAGTTISGVDWKLSDGTRRKLRSEVIADAVQDAVGRAKTIAAASGAGPVVIVEVADPGLLSSAPGSTPPLPAQPQMRSAAAGAFGAEQAVSLQPDTLEISETVHARFRA